MLRSDDTVPMRRMLDHAREIVAMVHGRTRQDLDSDRMFQLAMTRLIEIIGEAMSRVTAAGHGQYPEIPWPEIVNTHNRIIHEYDAVNYDEVWDIATLAVPALIAALERAPREH
jgi:uncharacterized protein with HEPN domain